MHLAVVETMELTCLIMHHSELYHQNIIVVYILRYQSIILKLMTMKGEGNNPQKTDGLYIQYNSIKYTKLFDLKLPNMSF